MCNGLYNCDIKFKMNRHYLAFVACLNILSFYIYLLLICHWFNLFIV